MVTEKELIDYAQTFLQGNFKLKLNIPIQRNNRLRSTLGRYVLSSKGHPLRIEISGNLLRYGTKASIFGVLRHECIHYAFHQLGRDMRDGSKEFELALRQFSAPITETLKVGKYYVFECGQCKKEGETRIKRIVDSPQNYRTNCCRGNIIVVGERIYRGIPD